MSLPSSFVDKLGAGVLARLAEWRENWPVELAKESIRSRSRSLLLVGLAFAVGAALALGLRLGFAHKAPPPPRNLAEVFFSGRGGKHPRCAPGRWRLASPAVLRQYVLPLSQILIRHSELEDNEVPFSLGWQFRTPKPQRTRAAARQLALGVRDRLVAGARFEDLVREVSDDSTSIEQDGDIGLVPAVALADWPDVLDCVATLRPGQLSEVVETRFGFHILQLRAPPAASDPIALRRLAIGHRGAPFLQYVARPERAKLAGTRTFDEANAIAEQVRAQLGTESFDRLVEQYSDHTDAGWGGRVGQWRVDEVTSFPQLIVRLSRLRVGETLGPVETEMGIQFFQREPSTERQQIAARLAYFTYDAEAKAAKTLEYARDALKAAKVDDPHLIPETWQQGRRSPALEQALLKLQPGQWLEAPVREYSTYIIGFRMAAAAPEPRLAHWGLPTEPTREVEHLVGQLERSELALLVQAAFQQSGERAGPFASELRTLNDGFERSTSPDEKLTVWKAFRERLARQLGATRSAAWDLALSTALDRVVYGEGSR